MTNHVTEYKLLNKKTRPTSMRILVYDFLESQNSATSLSDIEHHFHKADRITLYRTLKTFEEKGIIHSIQENHTTKYKLCGEDCHEGTHHDHHLHFYCKICKETTCKQDILFPADVESDFRIDEIRLFAKGICEKCLSDH